jgi:N,N'-diacetyllegionaminate synthase
MLSKNQTFVIAEMANSHEGDFSMAKKIIEKVSNSMADGIKFQRFTADELALPNHENYQLYKSLEMSNDNWKKLVNYAKYKKLKVFFDVFGLKTAKSVSKLNIDGIKIHSADLSNPILLKFLSTFKKTILLSTAGSYPYEIHESLEYLQKIPKEIILMHGFQGYPTSVNEMNLSHIPELKKKFNLPVGIMDHLSGNSEFALIVPLLAISQGATVIEKHITLDRSKKGLDYYSSLNPDEFKLFVSLIRKSELSFGNSDFSLSANEKKYRLAHKKNTIAKSLIKKDSKITGNLFDFKRTKTKKDSVHFFEYKNEFTLKDIKKQEILTHDMITHHKKKIAAVIACRVESARLFAKPFHLIDKEKYSILDLLVEQIKQSKLITDIVLAISENPGNDFFIKYAQDNNLKFVVGNDKDVLSRLILGAKYVNADIIFRVTSENPYIYWEGIDKVLKKHIDFNFDFSEAISDFPLGSGFEVINFDALEKSHRLGTDKHRSELCTLYIHENQKNFKIYRFIPKKLLQRPDIRLTVDNPEDLIVVRKIYENLGNGKNPITLKKIINFLDKHNEITQINSHMLSGVSKIWN